MSAQPSYAPVIEINRPAATPDLPELERALQTERSASKAILATMVELEGELREQRGLTATALAERDAERTQKLVFWNEMGALRDELLTEQSKPLWRRLLRR